MSNTIFCHYRQYRGAGAKQLPNYKKETPVYFFVNENIANSVYIKDDDVVEHDFRLSPTEFKCPSGEEGWYLCFGVVHWVASASGTRSVWFRKNGQTEGKEAYIGRMSLPASSNSLDPGISICVPIKLDTPDSIELFCWSSDLLKIDSVHPNAGAGYRPTEVRFQKIMS